MKYLALQNIYDHQPFKLVNGYYQDTNDALHWIEGKDYAVPDGVIVKAGSIVDMDLAQYRQKRAVKNGILSPLSEMEQHHFDLGVIFGMDIRDHFDGRPATMVDILHEYGIFTVEQVAKEASGVVPFTPQNAAPSKISMRLILSTLCDGDKSQVDLWVAKAKDYLATQKTEPPVTRKE